MTSNLSKRDLEALSNYLDGQLSRRQQRKLETRLQKDESLRLELANLRRTRAALRDLPRLKAPRHFTLTPEIAGQQVRGGLYPTMRLASALATILFVVVTFGDLITSSSAQLVESAQPVADVFDDSAFAAETSTAQDMVAENAAAEPEAESGVFEYAVPEEGDAAGMVPDAESDAAPATGLEVSPTATAPILAAESAAEPAPAEDAQEEQSIESEQAEEFVAQATQAPLSTPTAIVLGETDRSVVTEVAGLDDSPAPTQGFVAQPPADKGLEPAVVERMVEAPTALPPIRIVEIVLAAIALGLISFTLYLRRKA